MAGTVIIQRAWFTRSQLQEETDRLFAWGDNLARYGGARNPKSGQAFACRGEPNAVGIPTKRLPSMKEGSFLCDGDNAPGSPVVTEIDEAFTRLAAHLAAGGTIVWPRDGIGTGRALLKEKAPAVWNRLERYRRELFDRADEVRTV